MKGRKLSIKWRIFFYMIGFCIVLLGILWTAQVVFLENIYKIIKTMEIRSDAGAIGVYIVENRWDSLSEAMSGRDDLYVEVWTIDSGSIIIAGNYSEGIQAKMGYRDKAELFLELRQKGSSIIKPYYTEDFIGFRKKISESIMYSELLSGNNGKIWMIMVSANISPVSATVETLRYQLYAISAIMFLAAVFIALTLSRRVTLPIVRLNAAAGELAQGNYGAHFQAEGYREIERLADTLTHAAQELGKTEALRQELIANVSHDLRTPLTLITGYSEMIRDIPGENTPENMQVIIDESVRLTSLVNDLLDLSKIQANMTEPDFQEFSLTGCVSNIINRFSHFTGRDDYHISFESDCDITVTADASRISQVVYNLIANAVNYTGADKAVAVCQLVSETRVMIQVSDTGEGISPENLPYVWDRYFKVDKVHTRAVTGTGLGLSIVKSILNQHPGVEYGVESAVGQGSVFWFSMPITRSRLEPYSEGI